MPMPASQQQKNKKGSQIQMPAPVGGNVITQVTQPDEIEDNTSPTNQLRTKEISQALYSTKMGNKIQMKSNARNAA